MLNPQLPLSLELRDLLTMLLKPSQSELTCLGQGVARVWPECGLGSLD